MFFQTNTRELVAQLQQQVNQQQDQIRCLESALTNFKSTLLDSPAIFDMFQKYSEDIAKILVEPISDIMAEDIQDRIDTTLNDGEYIQLEYIDEILADKGYLNADSDIIVDKINDGIRDIIADEDFVTRDRCEDIVADYIRQHREDDHCPEAFQEAIKGLSVRVIFE